jgi:hypothetical protein
MLIQMEFRDHILSDYAKRLGRLAGDEGLSTMAAALNEGGEAVREQTVAAETAQTGLPQDTLDRAQQEIPASGGALQYTIYSKGGNIRVKYFHPVEGAGGVTAFPWGSAHFFSGAFITSGRIGARYPVAKLNGHVYERRNPMDRGWNRKEGWRKKQHPSKITQTRTGLYIPTEMVRGATAAAFEEGSAAVLATTVMRRLGSLLP